MDEYVYQERAAILEYEGLLPREEAERRARIECEEMKRRKRETGECKRKAQ